MRKLGYVVVALALVSGCNDPLAVQNPNSPNVGKVLATPADVENYVGSTWNSWFASANGVTALAGTSEQVLSAMRTMSFENSSTNNNFAMGPRSAIPRQSIDNSVGNAFAAQNAFNYQRLESSARQSANAVLKLAVTSFTIGTPQQDLRARAFAYFTMALSNGDNALIYDSVSVVKETDDLSKAPTLTPAKTAILTVYDQLDSAAVYTSKAIATTGGFTIPTTWMPTGGAGIDAPTFLKVIHSYKAHFRADVARNSTERAAVDWTAVIADAQAGITTDFVLVMDATHGIVDSQHASYTNWHQQSPMIIGMADSARHDAAGNITCSVAGSDCYDAWLATPIGARYSFLITTADKRFPSGNSRTAQNTNSPASPTGTTLYFRNRVPGNDAQAYAWDLSQYDYYRYQDPYWNTGTGPVIELARPEMDLLQAEGYIRNGDFASASTLINKTRVKNGLPAIAGITSVTQPIATGIAALSCVPRIPDKTKNYQSATCGNIFEAMKWEKRMETAYTDFGSWFYDSRGWDDLPLNTPVEWPTPYQELQIIGKPFYNLGGAGGKSAAPGSGYGY